MPHTNISAVPKRETIHLKILISKKKRDQFKLVCAAKGIDMTESVLSYIDQELADNSELLSKLQINK